MVTSRMFEIDAVPRTTSKSPGTTLAVIPGCSQRSAISRLVFRGPAAMVMGTCFAPFWRPLSANFAGALSQTRHGRPIPHRRFPLHKPLDLCLNKLRRVFAGPSDGNPAPRSSSLCSVSH